MFWLVLQPQPERTRWLRGPVNPQLTMGSTAASAAPVGVSPTGTKGCTSGASAETPTAAGETLVLPMPCRFLVPIDAQTGRRLSRCAEFFNSVGSERNAAWVGTLGPGLTCRGLACLRFDAGLGIGLTRAAEDWRPFVGLTWRN